MLIIWKIRRNGQVPGCTGPTKIELNQEDINIPNLSITIKEFELVIKKNIS